MKMRKTALAVLLLVLCLAFSGCRTRTGIGGPAQPGDSGSGAENSAAPDSGFLPEEGMNTEGQEEDGEPGGQTRENPEASRKEYDETRAAEVLPGTERLLHTGGEGSGLSASGENTDRAAAKVNEEGGQQAVRTAAAEEAERMGISEEAEKADSAATYYSVLLRERTGSLFECKRLNIYWETAQDHLTVFRTSPEHSLILDAGAYDVSARLLEGNLRVNDGWIGRKNPGAVIKAVDRSVLGTGVSSADAARRVYADLLARDGWAGMDAVRNGRVVLLSEELLEAPHLRLAAALMIAKTAYPDLFADTDATRALEQLGEEAAGSAPAGLFYYTEQGEA